MPGSKPIVMVCTALLLLAGSASLWPASAQDTPSPQDDPLVFTPMEPGPVIVVLTSGEQLRGELIEDRPGSIKIKVAEIEVRVPRDRIEAVYPENDLMERYRLLREAIGPDDAEQILFLAEWLRRNGMLDEALHEANAALAVDPTNGEGIRLRRLVEQQIRMRDRANARRGEADDQGEQAGEDRAGERSSFPLITPRDANLIKVFEVDLRNPPKLVVGKPAIDALLDGYGGRLGAPSSEEGRATFYRKPPEEILSMMFRLRARELYDDVEVLELPASLKLFRDTVNSTWLVNSCATTRCHGGPDAGRLMLANRKPSADLPFLTNLLILERHTLDDGTPMINYESPESSPLLQMTLPRRESLFPHPRVKGWKPVFSNEHARRFQQAVQWIEMMYKPRPTYPIEYTAPAGISPGVGGDSPDDSGDLMEPGDAPVER
ncbi:MAG: hypothetical protein H6813_01335 [Phycisphaeraceae bacterium]|nr:hypothetical protein [Phycisphaeraceae bacterium]MCB9847270.1 hypothetical protein [Phycisphaeraceae bacterium]